MKAYGLTGIERLIAHSLHIYFQLIYSHYAALQTSVSGFLPHSDIPRCRGREMGGTHKKKEKKKKQDGKRAMGGWIHSCSARELWHLWQRKGLLSEPTLMAPAHSFPITQSPLEMLHSLSRNEALPCLAGKVGCCTSWVYFTTVVIVYVLSKTKHTLF